MNVFYRNIHLLHLPVFAYCLELSLYQSNLILVKINVNAFITIQILQRQDLQVENIVFNKYRLNQYHFKIP